MEEEKRLQRCLEEVMRDANCSIDVHIRIIETEADIAFAGYVKTITVSVGLMTRLTDEELKGVLAHELGHVIDRDMMLAWAFVTASRVPVMVRRFFFSTRPTDWKSAGAVLLVFILLFLFKPMLILPVIAVLLFIATSWLLDRIFNWLLLLLSRICEYRQDAFAHRIGYGRGLCNALVKFTDFGNEAVNAYFIFMNGTHPVIYNRIHRLERLAVQ
jgi:heat shock protein HtpX